MKYLLDTNVISELVTKQPAAKVVKWLDDTDDSLIYLSVITIGEIKKGIEKLADSQRKTTLQQWLADDLLTRFQDRIVGLDADVMLIWGSLTAALEQKGRKLPAMDSLVAAIARHGQFTLVTRNEADFIDTEITILNPWQ